MNNINNKISNNNISSLDIKTFHTQVILFPNEDNNHTCICSATLETCDGRKFTDIGESTHHLLTEKQKSLIESKSKKKGLSGNESSQKIINKNIDELTGAEADLVIKSIL